MKKILYIAFTLLLVITMKNNVFANNLQSLENDVLIIDIPAKNNVELEQEAINNYFNLNPKRLKSAGQNTKVELVNTTQFINKRIGYADNQPSRGTEFSSPGGFYWSDGNPYVDVSFSIGYKAVSLSIGVGKTGTSGQYISSPYTYTPVKLVISKDMRVSEYKVYQTNDYGSTWYFAGYSYAVNPTRNYLSVEKV